MKALIVDDVEMNRELLAIFLTGQAEVVFAENGEDALTKVRDALMAKDYFDLICMDISMPGMDGHETMKKIRGLEVETGKGNRAVAFMVTGSSSPDDMFNAIVDGECDDYLTKPIMQKTFGELLNKHGLC